MEGGPHHRPTLRDVAGRAGVSFKTVSRVVNGEPGVSTDLVERVQTAVRELGYRRDDRARRLRQGHLHTGVIGCVLSDVSNPFFSAILRGIEEIASGQEFLVVSGSTDGRPDRERFVVDAFVSRRVDGLIAVPAPDDGGALEAEAERGTPIVFLDLEPRVAGADLVRSDHRGGARAAVDHLLAHGHRDIAFFGDDAHLFSAIERAAGYREALRAAGVRERPERVVHDHLDIAGWRSALQQHLARADRPTALFTAQNLVTAGAVRALHDLALEHTVALVGFDDLELADLVQPGITVVPQEPYEIGRRAAELVLARIHGSTQPPARVVLPCHVVARGSGELAPADRASR